MAPNPYLKAIAPGSAKPASGSPASASASKRKGTKRDSTTASSSSSSAAAANGKANGKGKARADDSVLKQEILALGGDDDDFELLQGVESDSEVEGDEGAGAKKGDPAGLLKDLRSFVKGLDFKAAGADAPADDADAVEDDDEEEAEEDSDDDEAEEEDEEAPAAKPVVETKPADESKPKKETKVEREARRMAEREAAKEADKALRADKEIAKLEKRAAKLEGGKSPWVVDPTPQWYAVPTVAPSASAPRPKPELISTMLARGQALLTKENELYASSLDPKGSKTSAAPPPNGLSKADQVFIQQILTSGTSSDRVSALLLLVSSSPLHTMSYLEQLSALTRKKSRDESMRAIRGLVDWFRSEGGGSPDRKLRYIADQPGLATVAVAFEALEKKGKYAVSSHEGLGKADVERCLTLWAYEDWFKRWFFQVLQALEQMSVDPLPHPRSQAVMHLSNLLRDKPEQESNILRLLVNKLGDTNRSIASKTSHHLLQVLQTHPGMTPMLVREVSALVLKPRSAVQAVAPSSASTSHVRFGGLDDDEGAAKKKKHAAAAASSVTVKDAARDNARYYGVTTLNQVMLRKDQGDVAAKMVDCYFEVFSDVLGRLPDKEEGEGEDEGSDGEKKAKPQGKKRARGGDNRGGKKGKGQQELPQDAVNDVDSKLVAAVLTGINRAFPFAKLEDDAFKRRLDTLFRITHTSTFNVSIQALMLIFHVSSAKRDVSDRFYRALYTSLHDPRLTHSSKQALYLNLVFRATKADKDANRVAAFVKRLIQVLTGMDTTFVLGGLFVVGELLASVAGLRTLLTVPETTKIAAVAEATKAAGDKGDEHAADRYDGKKREPKYAHAENSCLWELTPLLSHWHPTVASYAEALLVGDSLSAASDLEQFSLAAFLDRFVYRETKKAAASKGSSMMQPGLAGQDKSGRVTLVKGAHRSAKDEAPVNSDQFRRRNVHDVPVDQMFFHKFFTSKATLDGDKAKSASKRKLRRGADDSDAEGSDAESIADAGGDADGAVDPDELAAAMGDDDDEEEDKTDDELEEAIWKEMRRTMPRAKGDSDIELDDEAGADLDDDEDGEDLAAYDYSDSEDGAAEEGDGAFKSAFPDEEDDEALSGEDEFLEADDDLVGSDEDMPLGLVAGGSDDDDDEDDEDAAASKKSNKKRKLKHLPTFASADDYAHLLGADDEDDDL